MNWYKKAQFRFQNEDPPALPAINDEPQGYGDIGHGFYGEEVYDDEENLDDALWWWNGSRVIVKTNRQYKQENPNLAMFSSTHRRMFPDAQDITSRFRGRFDKQLNAVSMACPGSSGFRNLPRGLTEQLEQIFPGAKIYRF